MKIQLSELRKVIREEIQKIFETPVTSTLALKPGMKLRYTGPDMEVPAMMKVLNVNGDNVTVGDQHGQVRTVTTKDLHQGHFQPMP